LGRTSRFGDCDRSLTIPTAKDARKLFVGGLPPDIAEEEFKTFFEQFGAMIDCIVMVDSKTNHSRGFGFVSYHDPQVAYELLRAGNNGQEPLIGRMEMRGKMIEIKAAEPKESAPRRSMKGRKNFAPNSLKQMVYSVAAPLSSGCHYSCAYPYYNSGAGVHFPTAPQLQHHCHMAGDGEPAYQTVNYGYVYGYQPHDNIPYIYGYMATPTGQATSSTPIELQTSPPPLPYATSAMQPAAPWCIWM
jgi:hypothetical protein